jgi:allophanate hydrolase
MAEAIRKSVLVAVCGAHMSGLPLNWQLLNLGGKLISQTTTAPHYKLYRLAGFEPHRPGMIRVLNGGCSIGLEVWELPIGNYGAFVAGIPAPLGIGTLELSEGSTVQGFICEGYAVELAQDITSFGGWRHYIAATT